MTGRRLAQLAEIPVAELAGVGPRKVEALAAMEIHTVLDLLTHYPRRYVDRTRQSDIADLKVGDEAVVLATVKRVKSRRTRQGRMIVDVDVFDGTSYLHVVFFNQGWRAKQLGAGTQAVFFGKLERFRDRRQMTNPVVDLVGDRTGRIVPIYPQSKKEGGLNTWELAGFIEEALARAGPFADPLPEAWLDRLDLVDRRTAFTAIHNPDSMETAKAARRRLVLDELLRMQVALVLRKRAIERESKGIRHVVEGGLLVPKFHAGLPFALTGAQRRAIDEITADLAGPHPMHRLLQGDVGSGKTVVALTALLTAVQGGYQGAFMAPTEVLAEQHDVSLRHLLGDLTVPDERTLTGDRPLRVELLSNRTTAGERTRILAGLAEGTVDLLVGTHALLEERVGVQGPGRDRDRRAAPLRRRAAGRPAGQGRRPRRAGDDGHAHPPHRGHDGLRRPRRHHPRRAAAGPDPDDHPLGPGPAGGGRGPPAGGLRGGRRPPGLRGVPAGRGVGEDPGPVGHRGAGPAGGRGVARPAPRPAPRPDAVEGQGGGHGRRSAGASSTCWWPRPSSRWASTSPTPP